ncbi:MAG TPA: glutathione S-transferase N-terminal domain-containing protein [Azospirillaceae bacterium]|nr:glutathione S-transferase N-terminal domain-containing protein [Azospirillaceae bacterium]
MKLRYSQTSPFARKVLMVAHETGLAGRVETIQTDVWVVDSPLTAENPLSKVPTLVTDDGIALFDSPVICEYLDSLQGTPILHPAPGPARWRALRQQALADGICDAAVLRRLETLRPAELQSKDWIERQRRAMLRGLDLLEREAADLEGPLTIGSIAVMVTLDYVEFRWKEERWREGRPVLSAWFDRAGDRDSFRLTAPPAA